MVCCLISFSGDQHKSPPFHCVACGSKDCACLLTTSGSVVLVYPYSEKSDKLYSPLQRE
nr:MAG TPA: hypothetical protein [Bacteriophage sp.]